MSMYQHTVTILLTEYQRSRPFFIEVDINDLIMIAHDCLCNPSLIQSKCFSFSCYVSQSICFTVSLCNWLFTHLYLHKHCQWDLDRNNMRTSYHISLWLVYLSVFLSIPISLTVFLSLSVYHTLSLSHSLSITLCITTSFTVYITPVFSIPWLVLFIL